MKHTPLPWKQSDTFVEDDRIGFWIAECPVNFPEHKQLQLANAEFIVRACNSHYELLEALKLAEDYLSLRVKHTGGTGETKILPVLRQAIAKTESSFDQKIIGTNFDGHDI